MTNLVGGWSLGYCVSKSFLNAVTQHLAYELSNRKISVDAFCPGWVKTHLGGPSAACLAEQGADTAVWFATSECPNSGNFFAIDKLYRGKIKAQIK